MSQNLWSRYDHHFVGITCGVKERSFTLLFKQHSVWSLACQQRVFQLYHSENISKSFTHKMAAKASWNWNYVTVLHRDYVTVTLCIGISLLTYTITDLARHGASHGLQNGGLFTFTDYEVSLCYVRWLVYESVMNSRYSSLHVNLLRKTQISLNTI